jgi:hypothetical protein
MAQLDQRVSIRCRLTYLDEQETDRYIHHRMNVAGARGQVRFDAKAISEIHRASNGVPRLINLVTDRALLAAYTEQSRDIGAPHVKKAVQALRGEEPEIARASSTPPAAVVPSRPPRWRLALLGALVLILAVVGAAAWWPRPTPEEQAEALYWRGMVPRSSEDGEKALRDLVTDVKYQASPRIPGALLGLAEFARARGDRAAALQLYQQVIDHFPADSAKPRAVVYSAMVHLDSGDTVSACKSVAATDTATLGDRFLIQRIEHIASVCPQPDVAATPDSTRHDSRPPTALTGNKDGARP